MNSDFIIACLDEVAQDLKEPTVLGLDNASWHLSEKIQKREEEWNPKNLYLFYLPTYSPHLNLAENLWRKMKYEWLKPEHYLSAKELKEAVFNIVKQYDKEYSIKLDDDNFFQ